MVAPERVRLLEVGRGQDLEPQVPEAPDDLQSASAECQRLFHLADRRMHAHLENACLASSVVVVQLLGEALSLAETLQRSVKVTELDLHMPNLKANIEAL